MASYPTGVENHGGFLRIWFIYQGKRVRESLGVPDTPRNRKMAGELRTTVCYAIKTGNFDYSKQFPDSRNVFKFGGNRKPVTLNELSAKWMELKEMELSVNAISNYRASFRSVFEVLDGERLANSVSQEDILVARKQLMEGWQRPRGRTHTPKAGRKATTVNGYMLRLYSMFDFGLCNGYLEKNPFQGISPLKQSRPDPDPLTKEEYQRILNCCPTEQMRNMICFAVNTGLRHGELNALAWEDVDTVNWTVKVTRGEALANHFAPPKTEAGVRTIHLTQPAIEALKNQMPLTRMGIQHEVKINLRQNGETRKDLCTFIFSPHLTAKNGKVTHWYVNGSLNKAWAIILRKAGVRHRKAYETRHTYACWALSAGANPSFIANQMGHVSAQMIYTVYGKWMKENNLDQMTIMNAGFGRDTPYMPHNKTA